MSIARTRFRLKSILAAAAFATAAVGQLPPPPPTQHAAADGLSLRVQAALAADPTLKPHSLSLLVNVVDGVAVVGGPVPDEALIPHVEKVIRGVRGVQAVRLSAWVPSTNGRDDAFVNRVTDHLNGPKPKAVEPPRPYVDTTPLLTIPTDGPGEPRPTTNTVVARRPTTDILMEPVASVDAGNRSNHTPSGRPAGAAPLPYPTIPPTNLPTRPVLVPDTSWSADPATRTKPPGDADAVVRSDARYARLTVDVRSGTATVTGTVGTYSDVWDFAERLQKLPGIEQVEIGGVKVR